MRYSIFGESHGPAIGVVLEGVIAGLELDMEAIAAELARRAPGRDDLSTSRKEADVPEILSGVTGGVTNGAPLCAIIRNTDTRSGDYEKTRWLARPGHADWPAFVKYDGWNDYRGGGHFSGRLTAPLVFAGAVAKQLLEKYYGDVTVGAHIKSIAGIEDGPFRPSPALLAELRRKPFPTVDDGQGEKMQAAIRAARDERDSVGGVIECALLGIEDGQGGPDFGHNVEGIFSQYLFAVPGVKGVAFGDGFDMAALRGSQANDALYVRTEENQKTVFSPTNHSGGVNGGITNGLPIVFSVAMRPTASIEREQDTIDMRTMDNAKLTIEGRHDPCIVRRAVPVIEAAAALAACELVGF